MITACTIRRRRWRIRPDVEASKGKVAECDYDSQTLYIPADGDTRDDLDSIIHEALHAALPDMTEAAVEETANGVTRLLWRLGWRKDDEA